MKNYNSGSSRASPPRFSLYGNILSNRQSIGQTFDPVKHGNVVSEQRYPNLSEATFAQGFSAEPEEEFESPQLPAYAVGAYGGPRASTSNTASRGFSLVDEGPVVTSGSDGQVTSGASGTSNNDPNSQDNQSSSKRQSKYLTPLVGQFSISRGRERKKYERPGVEGKSGDNSICPECKLDCVDLKGFGRHCMDYHRDGCPFPECTSTIDLKRLKCAANWAFHVNSHADADHHMTARAIEELFGRKPRDRAGPRKETPEKQKEKNKYCAEYRKKNIEQLKADGKVAYKFIQEAKKAKAEKAARKKAKQERKKSKAE